jgi:RNA polymerase sigma-70 factor (ECF subfamily)
MSKPDDSHMLDEKELVSKVLKGDLVEFKTLVEQYQNLVFCVIRRVFREDEDVEDVCQEVFIKVHQHLARFKFQSKLSTWIAQITYRTALNYLKKQKRNLISVPTKPIEDVFLSSENIEQKLNDLDVAAYLEKLIAQLPEQYKLVLTLYHLKEFSYQEIEVITGMPEGTVKSYLFRARKMLKDKLANYLKNEQV